MKLPRDLSGTDLAKVLAKLGYQITRQNGSHMRFSANNHPFPQSYRMARRLQQFSDQAIYGADG
jgi:hypothetical protein